MSNTSNLTIQSGVSRRYIASGWTFRKSGDEGVLPAAVPGTVHTDLFMNGRIPDPYFRDNERDLQWIGYADWVYSTRFTVEPEEIGHDAVEMVLYGLDTYADVYLNGTLICSADNMFRTWRIDVTSLITRGDNELEVRFANVFDKTLPVWRSAEIRRMAPPSNDQADIMLSMYSRKAPFHFGWDWGPRLITCGIWRPVELIAWSGFRIEDIHVLPRDISPQTAIVTTRLTVRSVAAGMLHVNITLNGEPVFGGALEVSEGTASYEVSFTVDRPRLWWTNGLGEPYLYDYRIDLIGADGNQDSHVMKIGLRRLEVVREEDEHGRSFYIRLNGEPVFIKGANYIPEDNFQPRVTRERYERTLQSAVAANMNMLRVWGGGIYQDDVFYELCDVYGILVWQDMMFACAMYPADKAFLANVRREVLDNVNRIKNHPCIALYCGNNEVEMIWHASGWKDLYRIEERSRFENDIQNLFYRTIPEALNEADPHRTYIPTSPLAGYAGIPPSEGSIHYWGVWHGKKPFETFDDNTARFVTEYGFQSFPELSSIRKFTQRGDRSLHSPVMLAHQRSIGEDPGNREYGNRLIQSYMERYFKQPKDFESCIYVSQLLQAEGVYRAIESHRRYSPYTMGTLYWQLNDCWPSVSWSSIDYFGAWKALHYFVRKGYADILITPRRRGNTLSLYIVSDRRESMKGSLNITVWNFTGRKIREERLPVEVPARASAPVAAWPIQELLLGNPPESSVIEFAIEGYQTLYYPIYCREMSLPYPKISYELIEVPSGTGIRISTDVLAKYVYLHREEDSLQLSDNYFDMLPGETRIIASRHTPDELDALRIRTLADTYRTDY